MVATQKAPWTRCVVVCVVQCMLTATSIAVQVSPRDLHRDPEHTHPDGHQSDASRADAQKATVSEGSWPGEITWTLSCEDGTLVSGGAPYNELVSVSPGATCQLAMQDSYGDGWNGAQWEFLGQSFTLLDGSEGSQIFTTVPSTVPRAPSPSTVQATGDPHLVNVFGQRFDLHQEGLHTLVRIPQGANRRAAFLSVEAEARQMSVACSDMYFESVNLTGRWVGSHGRVFRAGHIAMEESKRWLQYGKVQVKVVQGHTKTGIVYLNLFVRHLKFAGYPVGGILGVDDHSAAATPSRKCQRRISLLAIHGPVLSPENASTAAADFE